MSHPKPQTLGSIWALAIAHVYATLATDKARSALINGGLLYVDRTGVLIVVRDDKDAPKEARFVTVLGKNADELQASRLSYVVIGRER